MSQAEDFVHLHVHTDYSMLDGAARVSGLTKYAAEIGQKALAITDHGYLFGAYDFYANCQNNGIKPIIGLEAYLTPGTSRFDQTRQLWGDKNQRNDDVSARGSYTHMTLLSRTTEGMHNLFRLGSLASLDGQMGKWPRADRDLLETYSKGLIGTSGCPSGEIQTRLRLGQWDKALQCAGELQDIFGKENFFIELMDHGLDIERRTKTQLIELSKAIGAPLLATNDSHYTKESDAPVQDALLCINSGSLLMDPDRFKFDGSGYFLRSAQTMRELFRDHPEACDNTLLVAEMCDVKFHTTKDGANYMPVFPLPEGEDETSWFIKEVEAGLQKRFKGAVPDRERKQAEYECGVITQMGFPGYFLVVADYINWAKKQGIRVGPGRGSGAGSIVAYAMGITELNPLEHGLMFERFLNPDRVSMPDFDVDFDERRRGEVIDYVTRRYGADRVAQVVTYGKIKAKQALKDSARIMGKPYATGESLTKVMPPSVQGKDVPVVEIYNPEHKRYAEGAEFRKYVEENVTEVGEVVELAKGLEGLTRQWGVHACAVIMSSHPLQDIIPMMKRLADGTIITQFDYPTCETLGLLKMDFLGLRNLTVISDALDNIVANGKPALNIDEAPLDDKSTYELLARGETLGVFQLDSPGMRSLLQLMKPTQFSDISAVGALYRPGPMGADSHTNYALRKNGLQEIEPIHPSLAEPLADILGETYGLIVYQEQVMAIAREVAGYSLGEADILRRAMGKKKKAEMDKQFAKFESGMLERGFPQEAINTLWEILVPFSAYAFNKSHSAAYGLVSYWTAYLKANYPTEYMAALLTSTKNNKDKLGLYLQECRRMGIKVLPPDVNDSRAEFAAVGEQIRFGLSAIQNVGEGVVEEIIKGRTTDGELVPYSDFNDFITRLPEKACNRRTIESLILAGAFDSMGASRRALQSIHMEAIEASMQLKRMEAIGQFDLFGGAGVEIEGSAVKIPDLPEFPKDEKLKLERSMLGLYVSDHPLAGLEALVTTNADTEVVLLNGEEAPEENSELRICGLITDVQIKTAKNSGNQWALVKVEDLTGAVDCMFFSSAFEIYRNFLQVDKVISAKGRVRYRDGVPAIYVSAITLPDVSDPSAGGALCLKFAERSFEFDRVYQLEQILKAHPGDSPVVLRLKNRNKTTVVQLSTMLNVKISSDLIASLKEAFGAKCLDK